MQEKIDFDTLACSNLQAGAFRVGWTGWVGGYRKKLRECAFVLLVQATTEWSESKIVKSNNTVISLNGRVKDASKS